MAMSPDKKDYGHHNYPLERFEKAIAYLKEQGILNLNACIASPVTEDEYLTKDSIRFHERLGYQMVAEFHQCGYKFHRWYDMVWMEKHIGVHTGEAKPVKPFSEIENSYETDRIF